ncbi:MerR family transcriptional regulator, partial [Streptomyces sp. CC53]|uniref:MerR family transcriptional regulator n=1 Tax=Streptomyces sp. CC53 TaxID=1906740 RepID=UPI000AC91E40
MGDSTHGLTTGAVARRLGVSPTTLRSWDRRYGMGPAAREDGRHRRWSAGDLAVLEEMCRLTASGVPPADAARAALAGAGRGLADEPAPEGSGGPGAEDAVRPGRAGPPGPAPG